MFFDKLEEAREAQRVVFIGYDPLEHVSAQMLANSIRTKTTMDLDGDLKIIPIVRDQLLAYGYCNRPIDPKGSTQFSITRFMVPHLMGHNGIGIFFDCDMLITRDIREMFELYDTDYAVQVVKHQYVPQSGIKMGGKIQHLYPRKNWSSTVIYNCDHPSTQTLTKEVVETAAPKFLHRFEWLEDDEIGSLDEEFNWLVEERIWARESNPFNIHHTLGSPLFSEKQDVPFADYWKEEFQNTLEREFTEEDMID